MAAYGADDYIDWFEAADLEYAENWLPWPDNYVEQWTYENNTRVQKFANRRDKSNFLVLYQI